MIKVSDVVSRFLVEKGVKDIFAISGGGIMHLLDSVGRQAGLRYICNHNEQASAIAAEGYARTCNGVGAILVTTGPGSTNALSGVAGAWVDSVPMLVISGQVRRDLIADYSRHRQLGPQEINIIDMARPVTKYAVTVLDPLRIRWELEKAWHEANTGRKGPVWVNIPLDVQGTLLEEDALPGYTPEPSVQKAPASLAELVLLLRAAKRPLWVFGYGIHLSGAEEALRSAVEALGFPAILTIGGLDLLEEDHPLNLGRFGPVGQRRANFALQNADLLVVVGASLSVGSIGFNTASFAPGAKRVMINIDPAEFTRPHLTLDATVLEDARSFLERLPGALGSEPLGISPRWLEACREWKRRYPVITPDYFEDTAHVNSYVFAAAVSELLDPGDVVLTGNSLDFVSVYHSFRVKRNQTIFTNLNYGAMGWDLPAAVGAAVARGGGRVVLITGDGSIQFNIQELLTVRQYALDLKIFVVNNQGYEAIRATQRNFFDARFFGSDAASGVPNPDYRQLAAAYGLHYAHVQDHREMVAALPAFLGTPGAGLCELNVSYHQLRSPRATSRMRPDGTYETKPLQDMFPFLPPDEVAANMTLFLDGEPS